MSKRAKQLLRENNELEEQIRDEAARGADGHDSVHTLRKHQRL